MVGGTLAILRPRLECAVIQKSNCTLNRSVCRQKRKINDVCIFCFNPLLPFFGGGRLPSWSAVHYRPQILALPPSNQGGGGGGGEAAAASSPHSKWHPTHDPPFGFFGRTGMVGYLGWRYSEGKLLRSINLLSINFTWDRKMACA